ncbi:MAG: hypothetical protein J5918_09025 [Prevotella sp.]|nr:hypothetical protein [Prevotella sp.]
MKKKTYVVPSVEIIYIPDPIMHDIASHMLDGKVDGEPDTNWEFGGDGDKNDDPEAKEYSWDHWDI